MRMTGYRAFDEVTGFEDYQVGDRFRTPTGVAFTEEGIMAFARQFDPQRFHLDRAAAEASPFGGIVAPGLHTLSAGWGHIVGAGFLGDHALGAPGMTDVRWLRPVRPGDRLTIEAEVLETRASASKPDRGYVTFRITMIGEDGAAAMEFVLPQIIRRKV